MLINSFCSDFQNFDRHWIAPVHIAAFFTNYCLVLKNISNGLTNFVLFKMQQVKQGIGLYVQYTYVLSHNSWFCSNF